MKKTLILSNREVKTSEERFEFEEGDLVLLERSSGSFTLGVFRGLEEVTSPHRSKKQGIELGRLYTLHPEEFFGETDIPLISPRINGREHAYDVSRKDVHFYAGQEEIVRKLKDTPGFASHAGLISTFGKPYLRGLRLE